MDKGGERVGLGVSHLERPYHHRGVKDGYLSLTIMRVAARKILQSYG